MNAKPSISSPAVPENEASGFATPSQQTARTIGSEELLMGAKELLIRHGEDTYKLRVTQTGKLILQK